MKLPHLSIALIAIGFWVLRFTYIRADSVKSIGLDSHITDLG